jgi:SagB-type dehydrogenase family enzyme
MILIYVLCSFFCFNKIVKYLNAKLHEKVVSLQIIQHLNIKAMKQLLIFISVFIVTIVSAQSPVKTKVSLSDETYDLTTFDTIKLVKPDLNGGKPLMQAISNRKTDRQFDSRNLSLKHLSEILWVANGINRANGKRAVPSAMGLYPLQTYAVLANGIYFYNPKKHQLEPVVKGDYRNLAGKQSFVDTAPLNLLFIAKRKKANDNFELSMMDSGYCGQNVYLYCASEGLKCVVRTGAKEAELLKVMKLDESYKFILAQTVGY